MASSHLLIDVHHIITQVSTSFSTIATCTAHRPSFVLAFHRLLLGLDPQSFSSSADRSTCAGPPWDTLPEETSDSTRIRESHNDAQLFAARSSKLEIVDATTAAGSECPPLVIQLSSASLKDSHTNCTELLPSTGAGSSETARTTFPIVRANLRSTDLLAM